MVGYIINILLSLMTISIGKKKTRLLCYYYHSNHLCVYILTIPYYPVSIGYIFTSFCCVILNYWLYITNKYITNGYIVAIIILLLAIY